VNRELARSPGVSQPTVIRIIKKLESKGIIKECTMLPDFQKLGYNLMAFTFVTLRGGLKPEEIEAARRIASEDMKYCPTEIVLFERGLGHGSQGFSFHFIRTIYHTSRLDRKSENILFWSNLRLTDS
jgi:DNA-binding Lrp family transcriptional regulator